MAKEIGATEALLTSIKTRQDGSVAVTIELNPENSEIINNLMNAYLSNEKMFTVAFVQGNDSRELSDG